MNPRFLGALLAARNRVSAPAAYTPAAEFAAGEQGIWYDPSDLTRYMDVSASPELVTNGSWSSGTTGWTLTGGTATTSAGTCTATNTTSRAVFMQALATVVGHTYRVSIASITNSAGAWGMMRVGNDNTFASGELGGISTGGTILFTATATTTWLKLGEVETNSGYQVTWGTVSAKRVPLISQATMFEDVAETIPVTSVERPVRRIRDRSGRGNHATAPSDAARPILRNRYNLLRNTRTFGSGWTAPGSVLAPNSVVAPDGSTTAAAVTFTTGGSVSQIFFGADGAIPGPVTCKVKIKAPVATTITVGFYDSAASPSTTFVNFSITTAWQEIEVTRAQGIATSGDRRLMWMFDASGVNGRVVHLWQPQCTLEAEKALPHQWVGEATDYDSDPAKFPLYLDADGSDDALVTGAINFSATDEMTVVGGFSFLASNLSVFLETGANFAVGGAFGFYHSYGGDQFVFGASGTLAENITAVRPAVPSKTIVSGVASISPSSMSLRVNGALAASGGTSLGSGNFGSHPLYLGARGGNSYFFKGRIYQLIVRGAATPDLSQLETFVAAKSGVTL